MRMAHLAHPAADRGHRLGCFSIPAMFAGTLVALQRRAVLWNRRRLHRRTLRRMPVYADWVARHDTLGAAELQALALRQRQLPRRPLVALLLAAVGEPAAHAALWQSLQAQQYAPWRLLVMHAAGDPPAVVQAWQARAAADRRVQLQPVAGPHEAHGPLPPADAPWCAIVCAGQQWRSHALLLLVEAALHHAQAEAVYGDEDQQDATGQRLAPVFKCDWNPELLLGVDAIGQPALWRRERFVGALRGGEAVLPAARHALALRATAGLGDGQVVHVPHVLLHVSAAGSQTSPQDPEAWATRVQQALDDRRPAVQVAPVQGHPVLRARHALPAPSPSVSIIIPTRNALGLLRTCVESIRQRSTYPAWDLLIVDNGSDDPECLRWLQDIQKDPRIHVRRDDGPFNYAALNNAAVAEVRGEFVALLNNDIEVITPGWLEEMVSLAAQPGVGAVGARLWYSDGTLQNGGVVIGIGDGAGHALKRLRRDDAGMGQRAQVMQGYSAVTAACLVVRRASYLQVGGLDAQAFAVAFNDIDFGLKLRTAGLRNLWTPHAELFHHESVSRGKDKLPANKQRFERERAVLQQRWADWLAWDPAYNPNLTLRTENFALADPPRVSLMRPWYLSRPWSRAPQEAAPAAAATKP